MYAVLNMGYTPSQYIKLSQRDRAFIAASIEIKIEEEKKQQSKAKLRKSSGRRRR